VSAFTYERHLHGYAAYKDHHEWVGDVFRCLATRACGGCGRWHGYTHTVHVPGQPQMNVFGFSTRDDVSRALQAVRHAWGQAPTPAGE
jgi:hypothetical protein